MKKIYVLIVVCLCFAVAGMAQTYYWVGPVNGLWSSAANWSNSSGGAGGAGVPNSTAVTAIFNNASTAKLDIDVSVNTLTITNTSIVKLIASGGTDRIFNVYGSTPGTSGLLINAGSRLENSTELNTFLDFKFADNSQGAINGEWYLTAFDDNSPIVIDIPQSTGLSSVIAVNSNASITLNPNTLISDNTDAARSYLQFNSGSFFNLVGDNSIVPKATYNVNSTISISGIQDIGVTIDEKLALGNVTYNCPLQSSSQILGLLGSINIAGNLQILSTGSSDLTLMSNIFGSPVSATISGDLTVSGTSTVYVSRATAAGKAYNLFINGNLTAGGSKFDFQSYNSATLPTTIFLKGNFQHTAGTFGAQSTAVNESTPLFVLELNGTTTQMVSSATGTIDNAAHQVSLRMNNAAGATLLTPLSVGRIDFSGANQGRLNTTATNILTIQNTSLNNIVVNSPSNSGYINGPFRRKTASTSPLTMPTGVGGVYRLLTITPSTNAATTYEANLISGTPPGGITSPLSGLANYYWDVSRFAGSADATISLTISGAVPGAAVGEGLVVAKYNGSTWGNAKGAANALTPGNTSSGVVSSAIQNTFNLFTIGYGNAAALPINLVSFTGRKNDVSADLSWKITENSTPVKFEILRSNDGKNFVSIGSALVTKGKIDYQFTDAKLLSGNNYYRLKMYDQDASVSYSNIIVIMNGTQGILISSMIPTVVRDRSKLNISSSVKGNMQLVITDISGRTIQAQNVEIISGNQEVWLNAGKLSAGMYQVTGYINGERTATMRFIKQ